MSAVLRAVGVRKAFSGITALDDVSTPAMGYPERGSQRRIEALEA